jgi:hypothetical protein
MQNYSCQEEYNDAMNAQSKYEADMVAAQAEADAAEQLAKQEQEVYEHQQNPDNEAQLMTELEQQAIRYVIDTHSDNYYHLFTTPLGELLVYWDLREQPFHRWATQWLQPIKLGGNDATMQ